MDKSLQTLSESTWGGAGATGSCGLDTRSRPALYDDRVTSPPEPSPASSPAAPPRRPVRVWDIFVTGILLMVDAGIAFVGAVLGLYVAESASVCNVRNCDDVLVAVGLFLATMLPWMLLAGAVILSIVLLALRRPAFWVPIVCAALIVVCWIVGAGLATAGIPAA